MAFPSSQPVQIVICPACLGQGCSECSNFGVYGLAGEKTLVFNLPPFLNLTKRVNAKRVFLIKRFVLILLFLVFLIIAWNIIANF